MDKLVKILNAFYRHMILPFLPPCRHFSTFHHYWTIGRFALLYRANSAPWRFGRKQRLTLSKTLRVRLRVSRALLASATPVATRRASLATSSSAPSLTYPVLENPIIRL
jgi:hypothetical protein